MRVKFDKDNDGFSMVELLAVMVIISLVFSICYVLYNYLIEKSKEEAFMQSKEIVMDVIRDYHEEFKNSENWVEGYNEDNKLSFCISIQSLINSGYYKGDEDVINEWKDKYIIHAIEENASYNYELIDINNSEVCNVTTDDMVISNEIGKYELSNDDSEVANLEYSVTEKEEFVYTINNAIKANILPKVDGEIKSYITLVLDRSGSMKDYYTNEEKAARCFVARMLGIKEGVPGLTEKDRCEIGEFSGLKNTEIALVEYALKPYLSRYFKNEVFPKGGFHKDGSVNLSGGTNTAYALTYAMMLNKNKSSDSKKFIILLYDGEPCQSLYYVEGSGKKEVSHYPSNSYSKELKKWISYPESDNINKLFFDNFSSKFDDGKIKIRNNSGECGITKKSGQDLAAVSNYLKENTDITLIVVGYKNSFDDGFKILSSQDNELCEGSSYYTDVDNNGNKEWYCWYKAETGKNKNGVDTLKALFDTLSSNLITKINNSSAVKVDIVLTPPENVRFFKNGEEQDKITYSIDLVNEENNNRNYSYDIKINEELFDDCDDNSCVVEVDMFNANIIYYNEFGNIIKENKLEEVPKLTFEYEKFKAIN